MRWFQFEDSFWKIDAITEEHYTKSHAKCQEGMVELDEKDGLIALSGDASVSPVISIAKGPEEVFIYF